MTRQVCSESGSARKLPPAQLIPEIRRLRDVAVRDRSETAAAKAIRMWFDAFGMRGRPREIVLRSAASVMRGAEWTVMLRALKTANALCGRREPRRPRPGGSVA